MTAAFGLHGTRPYRRCRPISVTVAHTLELAQKSGFEPIKYGDVDGGPDRGSERRRSRDSWPVAGDNCEQ